MLVVKFCAFGYSRLFIFFCNIRGIGREVWYFRFQLNGYQIFCTFTDKFQDFVRGSLERGWKWGLRVWREGLGGRREVDVLVVGKRCLARFFSFCSFYLFFFVRFLFYILGNFLYIDVMTIGVRGVSRNFSLKLFFVVLGFCLFTE